MSECLEPGYLESPCQEVLVRIVFARLPAKHQISFLQNVLRLRAIWNQSQNERVKPSLGLSQQLRKLERNWVAHRE